MWSDWEQHGDPHSGAGQLLEQAEVAGEQPSPARRELLTELDAALAARPDAHVALLVGDEGSSIGDQIARAYPGATLTTAPATTNPSAIHAQLAAFGPYDLIIDDTRLPQVRLRNFRNVWFHLKAGGAYVVCELRGDPWVAPEAKGTKHLMPFVAELIGRRGAQDDGSRAVSGPEPHRVGALGRVSVGEAHLVVGNRTPALAKMREHEVNRVLELRQGAAGAVLQTIPGTTLESRCRIRHTEAPHDDRYRSTYQVPDMSLREYPGVVCLPGQVALLDNLVLPDSYRHNQYFSLSNRHLTNVGHYFAGVPQSATPRELPGTYFYLDAEYRRHFGHLMTEQLSRLWAWRKAKEMYPDLKALLSINPKFSDLAGFEKQIFAAAGVPVEDLVPFSEPVRVERLVAATPMLSMPDYVHPDVAQLWTEVGDRLAAGAPEQPYADRIFVTRSPSKIRDCHNAAEVEDRFRAHGFEVLMPEKLPLAEQVARFRAASVVAGFAGSGLLSLCYCEDPKRVITIAPESYTSNNEYLIATVRGFEMDRVVSTPDIPRPEKGWSWDAFYSGFTFDFEREGRVLDVILRALDGGPEPTSLELPGPGPAAVPEPAAETDRCRPRRGVLRQLSDAAGRRK